MPDFSTRSNKKELLDASDIPFTDILRNMQELNTVNHLLGGHSITCEGLNSIIKRKSKPDPEQPWTVCEIGCGNGNNLVVLHNWCIRNKIPVSFIGIDINQNCIAAAESTTAALKPQLIVGDYRKVIFGKKPDVIFSSLFCHHFTDEELCEQLNWMKNNCTEGSFINDLQRHPFAYFSIKALTRIFSRSYLVKNDAPLSVLRGFTSSEWKRILVTARIDNFYLKWKWAFRWLIVIVN
jgi:hypothetical protein